MLKTERALLHDVCRGDRDAQRELYGRFSGCAASVAMRYVADMDAMKDVMQDSFVKVFTRIRTFNYRGEGSLKAWIIRIVANESLNYLKQRVRYADLDTIPDEPDDGTEPPVNKVPPDKLMKMIAELPEGYRTVINLFVFEQKSHKEIASLLGIKENSSASQYLRAKKQLANKIKTYIQQHEESDI
ncbi:MAG: sigma-70 family RNA polymerase sigma factor [Prevotella sp.]|nr:sigma-70 family RNA polymerase sigma factor [Prevotella sp.]